MRYAAILLDADETLFDFRAGEAIALRETLRAIDLSGEEAEAAYRRCNEACWRALERGEINQAQLRIRRFADLFRCFGRTDDPALADRIYVDLLSRQAIALPGAPEAVKALSRLAKLALVTNGISVVQRGRIGRSPFAPYLDAVVISEELGCAKPNPRIIHEALAQLGGISPTAALMVGDSLKSDIECARNAGCDACWINGKRVPRESSLPIRYEIQSIAELPELLRENAPGE